jgi:hypothetical protein
MVLAASYKDSLTEKRGAAPVFFKAGDERIFVQSACLLPFGLNCSRDRPVLLYQLNLPSALKITIDHIPTTLTFV